MRDLVGRLLAPAGGADGPRLEDVVRLNERLKALLIRLAGKDGFTSLEQRAVMLAKSDLLQIEMVRIGADGRLAGLEQLDPRTRTDAAMAITAHLLELLVSVIGERLTRRILREAWPDSALDE